ncbi:hypothetical protein RM531_15880 [Salinisphaera sp. P385]|uniref:Uncharacterized protein n=1 Tax=Spectribacter acetivorans TaxID=3075603 RepID=A0ABU3BDY3_9GAMM|nr:hypothetical protein [Salinisphaera sp. P385]MDT0619948.1 hypothetical protein [Salinisphaera sp. P385]
MQTFRALVLFFAWAGFSLVAISMAVDRAIIIEDYASLLVTVLFSLFFGLLLRWVHALSIKNKAGLDSKKQEAQLTTAVEQAPQASEPEPAEDVAPVQETALPCPVFAAEAAELKVGTPKGPIYAYDGALWLIPLKNGQLDNAAAQRLDYHSLDEAIAALIQ